MLCNNLKIIYFEAQKRLLNVDWHLWRVLFTYNFILSSQVQSLNNERKYI